MYNVRNYPGYVLCIYITLKKRHTPKSIWACRTLKVKVKCQMSNCVPHPYCTFLQKQQLTRHTETQYSSAYLRCNNKNNKACLAANSCNAWPNPYPEQSVLVGVVITFSQTLSGRHTVHFWVKDSSAHWQGSEIMNTRQTGTVHFFVSKYSSHKYPTIFQFPSPRHLFFFLLFFLSFHSSRQATLIRRHDILKHSAGWYGISPRLLWNRSRQLKHQPGTHFPFLSHVSSPPLHLLLFHWHSAEVNI